jgi:hypothetical protein
LPPNLRVIRRSLDGTADLGSTIGRRPALQCEERVVASIAHHFLPAEATTPSDGQRLFVLFFTGTLIDLVVLGLFAEFSPNVHVDAFSTALAAAVVLQILLKLTIAAEHNVLGRFKGKSGAAWTTLKFFTAWLILFGSKFVILEALTIVFGDRVHFDGVWHGIVWLIIVVVTMVIVEELTVRFYRRLG